MEGKQERKLGREGRKGRKGRGKMKVILYLNAHAHCMVGGFIRTDCTALYVHTYMLYLLSKWV